MTVPLIQWSVAEQTYPGEAESGDAHVVIVDDRRAMIAVIDGIGHGRQAAEAANAAVEAIKQHSAERVDLILKRCHDRLSNTRGAAMTLISFDSDTNTLTWLGAGNVTAVLVRGDDAMSSSLNDLLVRGGVVGLDLPQLVTSTASVKNGDLLVIATDGISSKFIDSVRAYEDLQRQANRILANFQIQNDDALVLIVRLNGQQPGPVTSPQSPDVRQP